MVRSIHELHARLEHLYSFASAFGPHCIAFELCGRTR